MKMYIIGGQTFRKPPYFVLPRPYTTFVFRLDRNRLYGRTNITITAIF